MQIGPSLSVPTIGISGAKPWTPAAFFASGEQGAWYDPSVLTSVFADRAGTTPASVDGPVGKILDLSGRGNHALAPADDIRRPTLRLAGGLYYLDFDGSDDSLATAAINFSATDKMSVFCGITSATSSASGVVAELSPSAASGNPGSFNVMSPGTGSNVYRMYLTGDSGTGFATTTRTVPVTHTLSVLYDIAQTAIADEITLRVNAAKVGTYSGGPAGGGNFGATYALNIGRRNGATVPFLGHIFALVVRGAMSTATEIAAVEKYIAGKAGVALT